MTDQRDEIIVSFDNYDDTLQLSETEDGDYEPGAYAGEARVEVDPLVEAFARSPYDPVIGAMMMGRATGEVIAKPPDAGWMRAIAAVLAVGMIGQLPITAYLLLRDDFAATVLASPSMVTSILFTLGGCLLGSKLLRASGS